ncbi:MAG: class I SAM-dependent methyltransferase [Saprospiraceae bacterium]|nr:class I SAM-dependent methyltransferase [Saprospiraceae bacterium]
MEEGYYKTKESVEEYIQLAKDVNGSTLIEVLNRFLPIGSTVLEIGSGPGTDWNILAQFYEVTGSDNSKEFLKHLTATYPSGTFLELDATALSTKAKYDGVYSNKVLHHLTDDELKHSIHRQHELIKEEGILCHSFWKGEGSEIFKGLFVNYHSEQDLKDYFERYFEILSVECYAEFEEGDSLLLIARKKG